MFNALPKVVQDASQSPIGQKFIAANKELGGTISQMAGNADVSTRGGPVGMYRDAASNFEAGVPAIAGAVKTAGDVALNFGNADVFKQPTSAPAATIPAAAKVPPVNAATAPQVPEKQPTPIPSDLPPAGLTPQTVKTNDGSTVTDMVNPAGMVRSTDIVGDGTGVGANYQPVVKSPEQQHLESMAQLAQMSDEQVNNGGVHNAAAIAERDRARQLMSAITAKTSPTVMANATGLKREEMASGEKVAELGLRSASVQKALDNQTKLEVSKNQGLNAGKSAEIKEGGDDKTTAQGIILQLAELEDRPAMFGKGAYDRKKAGLLASLATTGYDINGKKVGAAEEPVKITTDAQYKTLPSGTVFIDANGVTRRKP
jgi:hypothetical protein